ncbi:MAG: shikimate dehydrogenase [Christensenellaceae bacterium]|nr:shikimate dehydrogenase [Christensenellaceae bacterium]
MLEKKFCLIGNPLSHSFSKKIHQLFGYSYDLIQLNKTELSDFVKNTTYDGFNVTIPYKVDIISHLDCLDRSAEDAGSVNTVIKRAGKWVGFNTDIKGLNYLMDISHITLTNKKILILGSGGTSKTASKLAQIQNAKEILIVSRGGINNYDNLCNHFDADIIINTTPVGMYPDNKRRLIDLIPFKSLSGLIDVIYNPTMTDLIMQATKMGINCSSGLRMLVAQAKFARDLFLDETTDFSLIEKVFAKIATNTTNLVLIGMPSSGKSLIGKLLASELNRKFVDSDMVIESKMGMTIPQVFERFGEPYFRSVESACINEIGKNQGLVIATGGGTPFNSDCYESLKQNGLLVHLTRPLEKTILTGRPLLKDPANLKTLYNERYPKYLQLSDITFANNQHANLTTKNILRWFNEYYYNKRS